MKQATQTKIANAINKLGEEASYRQLADEAGVSLAMIQRYRKECIQQEVYTPNCIQQREPLHTIEIQETDLPERVIRRVHLSDNSHVDVKAGSMLSKIGYMGPLQNRYLSK